MSLNLEFSEAIEKSGSTLYDIAEKVTYSRPLTQDEKEVYELSDAFVRNVGKTGHDPEHAIAAFVTRTIQEEEYNAPDELLDQLFDRGTLGEFDEAEYQKKLINTLEAHEAAKGGTVDRSWLDYSYVKPFTKNFQVDTDLSYADMRRNGFKSVANLTTSISEALKNKLFYTVFSIVDNSIIGGSQVITAGGNKPTQSAWDEMSLYLLDRNSDAVAVCLSKYAQALGRMEGRAQYMADSMKENFNRYGLVTFADGVRIASISSAYTTGKGELLLPDNRIFGVAGKLGNIDMKGEIHIYQDEDNYNDKIILHAKDYTASIAITNIENVCKMVLTD